MIPVGLRYFLSASALLVSLRVSAQVDLQKNSIDSVVLKFVTNRPSTNRCLLWFPFDSNKKPVTEFDENGLPYARVRLQARVRGKDCNVSFRPQESMKLLKTVGNDMFFEVIVRPPTTVIDFNGFFNGPDFRDQLIFEAASDSLEEIDFFTFFRKSKVYFETRYASFTTNNMPQGKILDVHMTPVFGGKIGVPVPWIDKLIVDFSMFQNLGNVTANKDIGLQYSEFSFGLNYLWSGKETWGRPQVIPSVEYRGRNLYQTFVNSTIYPNGKPYLVGQVNSPRVGLDMSWFPGGAFYSWEKWMSRIGLDVSLRYAVGAKIPLTASTTGRVTAASLKSLMYDVGFQYRLTRKWALGAGYSKTNNSFTYLSGKPSKENNTNYYVRLLLVPYIVEGAE